MNDIKLISYKHVYDIINIINKRRYISNNYISSFILYLHKSARKCYNIITRVLRKEYKECKCKVSIGCTWLEVYYESKGVIKK